MQDIARLVQQARDGSPSELVDRFRGLAFRVAIEWLSDPHTAEDVVQEAFVEALQHIAALRDPSAFGSWLRMIVRKHADRVTRRRQVVAVWPDLLVADPAETVEERWRANAVRRALANAPATDRDVLALRYLDDLSYAEIAGQLDVPLSTVRKRLHDARRRLKPAIAALIGEETEMIGRIINSDGTPLDGGERVTIPEVRAGRRPSDEPMWTGIKVIDVCAPIVRGGTVELRGPAGTGQGVNVGEIIVLLAQSRKAVAVVGAIGDKTYGAATVGEALQHPPIVENALIVMEAGRPDTALRAADALSAGGRDVLLVVDYVFATPELLEFAGLRDGGGSVTVFVFAPQRPEDEEHGPLGTDTTLEFSRRLADARLYPAIDPVTSRSRLIDEGLVSKRHVDAAAQTKNLVALGSRLESFMSQPYVVAEAFTELPGEQVGLDDAIRDVGRIAAGEANDIDPKALLYSGTLDQVLERAR